MIKADVNRLKLNKSIHLTDQNKLQSIVSWNF